jgi:AcrR family transcriptional regulator
MAGKASRLKDKADSRARLSKNHWLDLALDILVKEGEAELKIDKLCNRLNVTKGSFYAHFKDRANFETEIVNRWIETFTTSWIAKLNELKSGPPEKRLLALMKMSHTIGRHNNDITFHVWAMHNPRVANGVRKADSQRFEYVKEIFYDLGFRGTELEMRTRVFLAFHSLQHTMNTPKPSSGWDTELELRLDFFVGK